VWEVFIHERWLASSKELLQIPAAVVFRNDLGLRAVVAMRFTYGRSYAAGRCATISSSRRFLLALASPLLPLLLTGRLVRIAGEKRLLTMFGRSLPWVLICVVSWAFGECIGYVRGR
jgi:hypothetical protein